MRSHILLAGAVVVAGGAALLGSSHSSGSGTAAEVQGAPLDDTVAYANLADKTSLPKEQRPLAPPVAAQPKLTTDLIDLDHVTLVGDHYEAKLRDGRTAVLTLDPRNTEAFVKKGAALEKLKRLEDAVVCYDRAIAVDESMTLAYLYKGGVYNQLERFGEALQCYEKALRTQQKVGVS